MSRICFPDEVLKDGVSNEAREDFEREVEIMSAFDRDNFLLKLMIILLILGELHCPETDTSQNIVVKVLKDGVSNEAREDFEMAFT